jgi:hypothetical protein
MLVVRVELHSAITGKITEIASMIIDNIGGTRERGDYRVRVGNKRDAGNISAVASRPQRMGQVRNYPRLSYNVWRLIARALLSAFPEEDKK